MVSAPPRSSVSECRSSAAVRVSRCPFTVSAKKSDERCTAFSEIFCDSNNRLYSCTTSTLQEIRGAFRDLSCKDSINRLDTETLLGRRMTTLLRDSSRVTFWLPEKNINRYNQERLADEC